MSAPEPAARVTLESSARAIPTNVDSDQRRRTIDQLTRRGAVSAGVRRVGWTLLLAVSLAAGARWATAQPWWSPALLAWLPEPAPIARWLRNPDLTVLPGLTRQWNPWAPLSLEEPESLLTRWKLHRLEADPLACQAWLEQLPETAQHALPDHTDTSTLLCGWRAASRISQLDGVRFSSPFPLACGTAVALVRWQRHALQVAAQEHLGSKLVRIEHLGSYACRNIGSGGTGQLSTHGTATAFDIAGFVLSDGQHISIAEDWGGRASEQQTATARTSDSQVSAFLRAARDGACRSFNTVLSPDHDDAHRSHFHLDRGPYRVCD